MAAQQFRQLGDIGSDAPRLIAGERVGSRSRVVEMYAGELLPVVVLHDEVRFAFFNGPGRREATGGELC
jgi:hypothetical protein